MPSDAESKLAWDASDGFNLGPGGKVPLDLSSCKDKCCDSAKGGEVGNTGKRLFEKPERWDEGEPWEASVSSDLCSLVSGRVRRCLPKHPFPTLPSPTAASAPALKMLRTSPAVTREQPYRNCRGFQKRYLNVRFNAERLKMDR